MKLLFYKQLQTRSWWLIAICIIAVSAVVSVVFAQAQSLWGDETTQLAGLSLSPRDLLDWLMGHDPFRFGVPPDRMPPLSYLLGQLWSGLLGDSEFSMRMFGLAFSIPGLILLAATLHRIAPNLAGILALLLFALSLNYIQYSIEIRPYAIVLCLASAMIYSASRYLESGNSPRQRKWLATIGALGVVAVYTHYTTLVFTLSLLGSLALIALVQKRGFWPVFFTGIAVCLATGPLVPLILSSMKVRTAVQVTQWQDVPRYFARLFSSRPEAVVLPVMATAIVAHLLALVTNLKAQLQTPNRFQIAMAITVASGMFGMMLSAFVVPGSMMQPHYSIWILPPLATLFVLPVGGATPRLALTNSIGLGVSAFCLVGSLGLFLLNVQSFSHSPARQIASAIAAAPADTTIVYDFGEDAWWNTYYPVRLRQGADRRQIMVLADADRMKFFNPESYMPSLNGTPMPELTGNPLADSKSVVLIRARSFDLGDMRRYIFGKIENIEKGAIETKLAEMNGLTDVSEQFVPGTTSARIIVMQKK